MDHTKPRVLSFSTNAQTKTKTIIAAFFRTDMAALFVSVAHSKSHLRGKEGPLFSSLFDTISDFSFS